MTLLWPPTSRERWPKQEANTSRTTSISGSCGRCSTTRIMLVIGALLPLPDRSSGLLERPSNRSTSFWPVLMLAAGLWRYYGMQQISGRSTSPTPRRCARGSASDYYLSAARSRACCSGCSASSPSIWRLTLSPRSLPCRVALAIDHRPSPAATTARRAWSRSCRVTVVGPIALGLILRATSTTSSSACSSSRSCSIITRMADHVRDVLFTAIIERKEGEPASRSASTAR